LSNCLVKNKYHEATVGCGLRKITRSPKVPNHEILGAQHLAYLKKVSFSSRPKEKKLVTYDIQMHHVHSPDVLLNTKIIQPVILNFIMIQNSS